MIIKDIISHGASERPQFPGQVLCSGLFSVSYSQLLKRRLFSVRVSEDGVQTPPPTEPHSLKCEGASEELLGSSEVGLFGWWAAEEEELMGSVHELQLLPMKRTTHGKMFDVTCHQAADNVRLHRFQN